MFGIQWVMPGNVVSVLFSWRNWLGKLGSDIWNMVPACLMWLVWKEKNSRTFFDWSRVRGFTQCSSILESQVSLRFSF